MLRIAHRLAVAASLMALSVSLVACGSQAIETESGLRLTIPAGAVVERTPSAIDSEIIHVVPKDGSWSATFISFKEPPGPMDDPVIGSADSSRVVVYSSTSVLEIVVQTSRPGSSPGRVLISRTRGSSLETTGMPLAREVWAALDVQGVSLP